jgi:hypothetical protein
LARYKESFLRTGGLTLSISGVTEISQREREKEKERERARFLYSRKNREMVEVLSMSLVD